MIKFDKTIGWGYRLSKFKKLFKKAKSVKLGGTKERVKFGNLTVKVVGKDGKVKRTKVLKPNVKRRGLIK